MNKELKRVSAVVLLMFVALFGSTTVIQVFATDALRDDARNVRTLYDSYAAERGPILVAGEPIVESVPVDSEYKFQRVYNQPELYAPITGYFTLNQLNPGVEGELNDFLSGTANEQFLDNLTSIVTGQSPKGAAVELTLDPAVQQVAYEALGEHSGAIVALDPTTGAVLAIVSKPTFDPNRLAVHNGAEFFENYAELESAQSKPLVNRAIVGHLYPPGSVFKILMTAAALDSGRFTPESTFPNPASLQLPQSESVIFNWSRDTCGPGETATVATALRLSCNIPFAELGLELGQGTISEYAEEFGFGDRLEIPLPVTPSTFPDDLDDPQLMLASFGQGNVRVSPLQVAMISAAVANDGVLMLPQLVKTIIAPDFSLLQEFDPEVYSTPMSQETANLLTQMMVSSVADGAASNARIGGVDVAGKTGTAENAPGEPYTLWFTGFAPADDPQVAIAVVIENTGGRGQAFFGNSVAAPIAKKVLEAVLNR